MKLLRENINKKLGQNPEIAKELHIKNPAEFTKISDQQLEKLQERFPIINTTPSDLKEYGRNLYEKTGVKRRVDHAAEAKNQSVEKINGSTIYYRNRLADGQVTINRYFSGVLNFSEHLVDKYVAPPKPADSSVVDDEDEKNISLTNRFFRISNKVADGAKYRTVASYETAKYYASQTIRVTDQVVRNSTSAIGSSIKKAIIDTAQIRDAIFNDLINRSRAITAKSESAVVNLTKSLSNMTANISDRLISSATLYLPKGMEKSAAALVTYTHHWQERIQQASSTKDIWHVATDETRNNFHLVQKYLKAILKNDLNMDADKKRW